MNTNYLQPSEFKVENSFSCANERLRAWVKICNFSLSRHSENDICQQNESIYDNKIQKLPFKGLF